MTEIANTENVIFQKPVKQRAGFLKVSTKLTSGKTDKKKKKTQIASMENELGYHPEPY